MAVVNITKDNYNEEVLNSSVPVLIDFWAEWCGPCRMLSPVVDKIGEENSNVKVCKVNVDAEPDLAREFKVMNIPLLVVIKDGKIVNKSVGVISKDKIEAML